MTGQDILWRPSPAQVDGCNLTRYLRWLESGRGLRFAGYDELWRWSVTDLEGFWSSIAAYFEVRFHAPAKRVIGGTSMPGAEWFPGATLNYAEHALAHGGAEPALVCRSEAGPRRELSRDELRREVAAARAGLLRLGVGRGDRVVAYLPNGAEAVIAFLATASLGAIWSSCPPEFGVESVLDRFRQIEPKVLIGVDRYDYNGRVFDRSDDLNRIVASLPTLNAAVVVRAAGGTSADTNGSPRRLSWQELTAEPGELAFEPVPFDHPLWILYSSGTTGLPKAIVQGHGGILVEHLKQTGAAHGPQPGRPLLLVHDHRLDDVELPGLGAAPGDHRGALRRLARLARPERSVPPRRRRGSDLLRRQRALPDGLPGGGSRTRQAVRLRGPASDRLDRGAACRPRASTGSTSR